jgi:hypothetical protein
MKWIVLFVGMSALIVGSTAQVPCDLGEFKMIALTTHHPYERKAKIIEWLKSKGSQCDKEQVAKIYNNLASFLGTSDDAEVRYVTYEMYRNAK